jgi:HSP20 family protein
MTGTEIQRVTTNGTGNAPKGQRPVFTPRVDVVENENEFMLYADLPGVKQEDVSLECKGDELILHAKCSPRGYGKRAIHAEYGVGDFYRVFAIADRVDREGIEASLSNGVLTVRVPKAAAIRPKRIAVKG